MVFVEVILELGSCPAAKRVCPLTMKGGYFSI